MLRVAIVGCGLIGRKRARVIQEDPSSSMVAACDVLLANARETADRHGEGKATPYQDWQSMLSREKLDVLIAATPNKHLCEVSVAALSRGIHVLCEKPLGRNLTESRTMVEAAERKGVWLKTGFNHRYHPALRKAHDLTRQGVLGDLLFARLIYGHGGRPGYESEWRASRDVSGGGELLDQGVHVVDLLRWFMGPFEEAFGYTPTCHWKMEVEDNAFALFKTSGGKIASIHTSWTQWKNRFSFEIYGERGYLAVEGLGGSYGPETLRTGWRRTVPGEEGVEYAGGAPDEETLLFEGPDASWEEEWRDFTEAIREHRDPLGTGRDGLEANRMIDAVYRSARENRPVKINDQREDQRI